MSVKYFLLKKTWLVIAGWNGFVFLKITSFLYIKGQGTGDFKSKIVKFVELFTELQVDEFIDVFCLLVLIGELSMMLFIIPFSKTTGWYIEYFHSPSTMNLYW